MRNDGQRTRRIRYTVTVRGAIPADIGAKMSAAHAEAIKNQRRVERETDDGPALLEEGGL